MLRNSERWGWVFYDLSKRFTLRAQSGEQSAIDLIFTVRAPVRTGMWIASYDACFESPAGATANPQAKGIP